MEKETEIVTMQKEEFYYNLFEVVEEFRKEFKTWQAGIDIDIYTIRRILIPLLEKIPPSLSLITHP